MLFNIHRANYFLLLALGATLIGFAPIFVKWSDLSPSWILFYRMLLTLPFLVLLNLFINKRFSFKVRNKSTIIYTAIASAGFTIDLILWHWSMGITSVSNATIIINSAPIFVAFLTFLIFKQRLEKIFLISFLITYAGIVGLIFFSNNYANGKVIGDLMCLLAAFFYAIYLLVISRLGKESSLTIIFYTTFFCCLFSLPFAFIESGLSMPSTKFEWTNLLLLALLCQFGGQFLITYGISNISASDGSIGLLLQPLTATILAAYIFNELINTSQLVFIFIALFGIYLARLNITKK
ncbi:DMT family transporter [Gammaproteobacteria bacterium]|jgi:drug/metabolite transporter (DMT)-like permease|nr:DMT family transporter [Gammaproteobacteria bacterium]